MISIFYLCDFPLGCLQAQMIHYFQSFSPCIRVSQTQGLSAEVRSLAESIWVILTKQEQKLKSTQTVTLRLSLAMPYLFQRERIKGNIDLLMRSTSIPL